MTEDGFFTILDSINSTNNYAMASIDDGLAKHGMAWFAHEQTAGKGQRGKSWSSEKGKNIAMSLVLTPGELNLTSQFHLSALVAVTCFEFLSAYVDEETKIKWPNDLFWRDRKAGGILIENKLQGETWKWAVVGIGININQTKFSDSLHNAVSIKQITGKTFNTIDLAKELYNLLLKNLLLMKTEEDVIAEYNLHLYKINKAVTLNKGGYKFETVIKEVSPEGLLITVDAIEHQFGFGEVEWVL